MILPFWPSAVSGGGFRVWPHGALVTAGPHHPILLTVHPQAELATSHKCLSHKVKKLTEENQGLRAEQPPSSAPWGLEQDEGHEDSLPSSVPVSGVWVLRTQGPLLWPPPSTHRKALARDHGTQELTPGCCVLAVSP